MQIAVIGDTHGHVDRIEEELKSVRPDYLLFTGDFLADGLGVASRLKVPFYGVYGNCDRNNNKPQEQLLIIDQTRIYMVHGHQYSVKTSLMRLYYRAMELEADIVAFGHTHVPMAEMIDGLWFINPGSPVYPRSGHPGTYILLEIVDGQVQPAIINLDGGQ